jgi:hypothetical protein
MPGFTRAERQALQVLRARYQQGQERWTTVEQDRLAFARWLYETGRLRP